MGFCFALRTRRICNTPSAAYTWHCMWPISMAMFRSPQLVAARADPARVPAGTNKQNLYTTTSCTQRHPALQGTASYMSVQRGRRPRTTGTKVCWMGKLMMMMMMKGIEVCKGMSQEGTTALTVSQEGERGTALNIPTLRRFTDWTFPAERPSFDLSSPLGIWLIWLILLTLLPRSALSDGSHPLV